MKYPCHRVSKCNEHAAALQSPSMCVLSLNHAPTGDVVARGSRNITGPCQPKKPSRRELGEPDHKVVGSPGGSYSEQRHSNPQDTLKIRISFWL